MTALAIAVTIIAAVAIVTTLVVASSFRSAPHWDDHDTERTYTAIPLCGRCKARVLTEYAPEWRSDGKWDGEEWAS